MEYQKSISQIATLKGVGVHTGIESRVLLKPAPEDHGIIFRRVDKPGEPAVRATVSSVSDVSRGTNLRLGNEEIKTIEHLMATLSGLGIDNIEVELNGPEIPMMDGGAGPFVDIIRKAGIRKQKKPRKILSLAAPVYLRNSETILAAFPAEELRIACTISFEHPLIRSQYLSLSIDPATFEKEIAPARTFGFYRDALPLLEQGLIKGTNLENTVVIGDDFFFCRGGLRFPDEFVRHKILDLLGDLYLLGHPIKAMILAVKPGHDINIKLVNKIREVINE